MQLSVIVFVMITVLTIHADLVSQVSDLTLSVELSRENYLLSEPVYLDVHLINNSAVDVKLKSSHLADGFLRVVLTNDAGQTSPYGLFPSDPPDSSLSLAIKAHDSVHVFVDVLPYYGIGKRNVRYDYLKTFLIVGSYGVQAIYESGYGRIRSNVLKIKVSNPTGRDRDAYRLLADASELALSQKKAKASQLLDTIIQQYGKSSYHTLAFVQKMRLYDWSSLEEEQWRSYDAAVALFEAHPSSDACVMALNHVLIKCDKVLKNPEQRRQFLQILARDHPATRLGKNASKTLQKYYSKQHQRSKLAPVSSEQLLDSTPCVRQ